MKRRGKNTAGGEIVIAQFNPKNRTVSDERLSDIFAEVGWKYGFDQVKAEFISIADFKIRWQRSYKWVEFKVSDYFDRAPENVLYDLAENLFRRILGKESDLCETVVKYVTDDNFAKSNRQDYFDRHPNYTQTVIGEFHDLNDSVNRLRDLGLIRPDTSSVLTWDDTDGRRAVKVAVLMRTVAINKGLDAAGVPETVLDYCVYRGISALETSVYPERDDDRFRYMLDRYPMKREAERWLDQNGFSRMIF